MELYCFFVTRKPPVVWEARVPYRRWFLVSLVESRAASPSTTPAWACQGRQHSSSSPSMTSTTLPRLPGSPAQSTTSYCDEKWAKIWERVQIIMMCKMNCCKWGFSTHLLWRVLGDSERAPFPLEMFDFLSRPFETAPHVSSGAT